MADRIAKEINSDMKKYRVFKKERAKKYDSLKINEGIKLKVTDPSKPLGIKAINVVKTSLFSPFLNNKKTSPTKRVIYLKKEIGEKELKTEKSLKEKNPLSKITKKELATIKASLKKEIKAEIVAEIKKESKKESKKNIKPVQKIAKEIKKVPIQEKIIVKPIKEQDLEILAKEDLKKKLDNEKKTLQKAVEAELELMRNRRELEKKDLEVGKIESDIKYQQKIIDQLKDNIEAISIVFEKKDVNSIKNINKLVKKLSLFTAGILTMPVSPLLASASLLLSSRIKGSTEFVQRKQVTVQKPVTDYSFEISASVADVKSIMDNLRTSLVELEALENAILNDFDFIIDNPVAKESLNQINQMKIRIQEKQVEVAREYDEIKALEIENDYEVGKSR